MIPNSIKIGGIPYEIILTTMVDEGNVKHSEGQILINKDLCESKQELALIHEIIEIIIAEHELKIKHHKIMTISNVLHQIIIDNTKLFRGD
jgi:hypothetical protein